MKIKERITKREILIISLMFLVILGIVGIFNIEKKKNLNLKYADPKNLNSELLISDDEETTELFQKVSISDLSKLEGNSYVLASINSPYNIKATLTSIVDGIGLRGNKTTEFSRNLETLNELPENVWTFQNGVEQEDGTFLYQVVNNNGEYLHINGVNVTCTTDETDNFVLVHSATISSYTGQILISDINSRYYLNWYGSENSAATRFAAWNSADKNSHIALYKQIPENEIIKEGVFFYEKANITNADEVNGKAFLIVNSDNTSSLYKKSVTSNDVTSLTTKELIATDNENILYSTSTDVSFWTFIKNEENDYYTINTTILGEQKYLHIDVENTNNFTSLSVEDTPQEFEIEVTTGGIIFLKASNESNTFYINLSGETNQFIGYNVKDTNSQLTLYTYNSDSDMNSCPALIYDPLKYFETANIYVDYVNKREGGQWGNKPAVESSVQLIVDGEKVSNVINGDEINNRFIHYDGFSNEWTLYKDMKDIDLENFQDESEGASHVWGKEFVFDYWEATDIEGNICYLAAETDIIINDDGTFNIKDINDIVHTFARGTVMTAKYTEFSDLVSFYVNYTGTILDVTGDVGSRNTNQFTKAIAIGHIYHGKQTVGADSVFAQEVNKNIVSLFCPNYDKDNPNTQIVIESIADLNNDNYNLVKFEVSPGENAEQIAKHIFKFITSRNETIKLSSNNNPQPTVSLENVSSENYGVRWYVLKELSDGWHIDGVLIGQTKQVNVTKSFHGLDSENENLLVNYRATGNEINNYNIIASLIKENGIEPYFKLATSNETEDARYNLFTYNEKQKNAYSWTINCVSGESYQFEESNYDLDGYNCSTVSTMYYKDGTVEKKLGNDIARVVQANSGEVTTISFDNYYTPEDTGMFFVNKVLTNEEISIAGAKFLLESDEGTEDYSRTITSDDNGIAFFNELKVGTYVLTELEAPEGFKKSNDVWKIIVNKENDIISVGKQENDGTITELYSSNNGFIDSVTIENEQANTTLLITKQFDGLNLNQVMSLVDTYEIEVENTDNSVSYILKLSDDSVQVSTDGLSYTWIIKNIKPDEYIITEQNYFIDSYLDVIVSAVSTQTENLGEVSTNNGVASFSFNFNGENPDKLTIINQYINNFNLQIEKNDINDTEKHLAGAIFKVYGGYEETTDVSDSITVNDTTYYYIGTTEETNENGLLNYSGTNNCLLKLGHTYALVEIVAPDTYRLDNTPILLENVGNENPQYHNGVLKQTISNEKKQGTVTVHHYIEGTTNNVVLSDGSVAEDEVKVGYVGDPYLTTEKEDISKGYELVATPANSTGTYTEENIEVIYYYQKRTDIKYSIEYYYDGVIDESKTETLTGTYEDIIDTYTDKNITGYRVEKTENLPLEISADETANVIRVYYVKDEFSYTVEYYYDGVIDSSKTETLTATYKDIIDKYTDKNITGYKLEKTESLPLEISADETTNVIKVYYVKDEFSYTVEYYYDGVIDESKTEKAIATYKDIIDKYTEKNITGYRLEKTENLPLEISADETTNVIKVYYIIDDGNTKTLSYTVEYYKDNVKVDLDTQTVTSTVQVLQADTLTVDKTEINIVDKYIGYKFDKTELNTEEKAIPETVNNGDVIKVYYVKDKFDYTVEYYYDGVIDESKTEKMAATYKDVIDTYTDKNITGYKLEKTENLPLEISADETANVIKVYYVKDEFSYTVEYYYDGVIDESKTEKKVATYEDIIDTYTDKTITGYTLENVENLPLTITEIPAANIIKVYYAKDKFNYTVNYYYDGIKEDEATESSSAKFGDIIESYPDKIKEGYKFEKVENLPLTVTEDSSKNIINVYYVRKDATCIVKYVDKTTGEEIFDEVIKNGKVFDEFDVAEDEKEIPEYTLVEKPDPTTGTFTEETQIKTFYYEKNTKVIVKYLEKDETPEDITDNKVLSEEVVINGYVGKDYVSEQKEIENYTFIENTNNTEGTMTEETITVVYYYLQNTKIIVNHIDKNTDEILKTSEEMGKVGDEYTSSAENFEGYVLVEKPEQETVIMTKEVITLNYYYVKVSAGVIEKHINFRTNEMLDNKLYEGNEGDKYSTSLKEFEGYDVVTNEMYYTEYVKNHPEFLEENEVTTVEELLEKKQLNPKDNYIPENHEGTMTKEIIEVKYYYIKKTAVQVEYIDKITGEKITEGDKDSTEVISGYEGDSYTTNEKEFEGYDLVKEEYPSNSSGTMKETLEIVRYYYIHKASVVEKHIDIKTDKLIEEETIYNGHEGDSYTTSEKEFEGYDVVTNEMYYTEYVKNHPEFLEENEVTTVEELLEKKQLNPKDNYIPENHEGTMTKEVIEVKYYYIRKATVLVEYIDKATGEKLKEIDKETNSEKDSTERMEGHEGDAYKTEEKAFENYVIVKEEYPTNKEGTMEITTDKDGNIVTETVVRYYYVHKSAGVVEKHIDAITGELLEKETIYTGNEGDPYKTASKKFEGYDLVETKLPTNAEGKMTKEVIEVKYYYIRKTKVIVRYLEKDTNKQLREEITINGHEGDSYNTEEKTFDGYTLVETPKNKTGKMTEKEIIVTYYYSKKAEPAKPSTPSQSQPQQTIVNNTIIIKGDTQSTQTNTSTQSLPKTGDTAPIVAVVIMGLVVLGNIIQIVISKRKKG